MSCCCANGPTVVVGAPPEPPEPVLGQAAATANLDLLPAASGAWLPVPGAEITLPEAGIYELDYSAAGAVNIIGPAGGGAVVSARLFDTTASAEVPMSNTRVAGAALGSASSTSVQGAGSRRVFVTVTGPTTIRLEGMKAVTNGTPASFTGIIGSQSGLSFLKVAD